MHIFICLIFFQFRLDLHAWLKGSNLPGARFGMAIVNLHDINKDSFEDVAIGAPYEEGSGAVYIYNGAKNGLHKKFSQRILARTLNSGLRGFGYSFSRPLDIDSNHYEGNI